jgi:hypothetical protein
VTAEQSPDRSGGPTVHLRERYPPPNWLYYGIVLEFILWMIGGFVVFYMKSGSWMVGVGATILPPGGILLVGPAYIWCAVIVVGARGPFWRLYRAPLNVDIDASAIRWVARSGERRELEFRTLGGVSTVLPRPRRARLRDEKGAEIADLPADVVDVRTRRSALLSEVVVSMRPDRYEMLPNRFWQRSHSCALRTRAP